MRLSRFHLHTTRETPADAEIASHKGRPDDRYEVLPWDDWMERALDAGLHPAVAALVEVFDEPGAPTYPMLLREK